MGVGEIGRPGIILDRDGTLIDIVRDEETGVITTAFHPSHLRLLSGVEEGLGLLHGAGYVLAIATNQPGPAKGHFGRDAVTRTNDALVARLAARGIPIAQVATCMHHPHGGEGGDPTLVGPCDCRKPKPGLLHTLIRDLDLDPARSWMVGDTSSDVEAGRAAGVRTALLFPHNRCELCPLRRPDASGNAPVPNCLPDVARATILELARQIEASTQIK